MASRNPFAVLEIPVNSSLDDVRMAYRALARRYHPDVNRTEDAAARMREINAARDRLNSEEKLAAERVRLADRTTRASPYSRARARSSEDPLAQAQARAEAAQARQRASRGIRVSMEPRQLTLVARPGASASFTVRAHGVSGDDVRVRYSGQDITVWRRAAEFGHATFIVTAQTALDGEAAEPLVVPVEVYIRRQLITRLPVTLESDPNPQRSQARPSPRPAAADRPDITVSRSSLNLPGKRGCRASFEVRGEGLSHRDVIVRSPALALRVDSLARSDSAIRFGVEVLQDVPADFGAQSDELEVLVDGKRLTRIAVTLTPVSPSGQPRPRPALPTELTFGKYRGQPIDQIARRDSQYLWWVLSAAAGPANEREAIRQALRAAGQLTDD